MRLMLGRKSDDDDDDDSAPDSPKPFDESRSV